MKVVCICKILQGGSGNATHFHNTPLEEAGVVGPFTLPKTNIAPKNDGFQ